MKFPIKKNMPSTKRYVNITLCAIFLYLAPAALAGAGDPIIITNPGGTPVVIQAGQILFLRHQTDDPGIVARIWSLLDSEGNLVPGSPEEEMPIFDWIGHSESNPLFLSVNDGTDIEIRIFEEGVYTIFLEVITSTISVPPLIEGDRRPFEEGEALVLTAPDGSNYRWTKNGVLIDGETGQTLSFDFLSADDSGTYIALYDDGQPKQEVQTEPFIVSVFPVGSLPLHTAPAILIALCLCALTSIARGRRRISTHN